MKQLCFIAIILTLSSLANARNASCQPEEHAMTQKVTPSAIGGVLSYKELSVILDLDLTDNTRIALRANIDLSDVVTGKYLIPGFSADLSYLFIFAQKTFSGGEKISFYAGPGVKLGHLRSKAGRFGLSAGLCGTLGMEYLFVEAPVALGLSLNPAIIATVVRPEGPGLSQMEFYRPGLINTIYPRVCIKYKF